METQKIKRNDLCFCGSTIKYKRCCLLKTEYEEEAFIKWSHVRGAEQNLLHHHFPKFLRESLPADAIIRARDDFFLDADTDLEIYTRSRLMEAFFKTWFYFNWVPTDSTHPSAAILGGKTIALNYLEKYSPRLNEIEKTFIREMCNTYYSFYTVEEVILNKSIRLKDIILGTEITIQEISATGFLDPSEIVFTRILSMNNTHVQVGMAPFSLPPACYDDIIDFWNELKSRLDLFTDASSMLQHAHDLRILLFDCFESSLNLPMPLLLNSEGDPLEFCEAHFDLHTSVQDAYNILEQLSDGIPPKNVKRDSFGALEYIERAWAQADTQTNSLIPESGIICGTIKIATNEIIVEVNSYKRAEHIQTLLKNYLGDKITVKEIVECKTGVQLKQ